jgi:hypothetical protein
LVAQHAVLAPFLFSLLTLPLQHNCLFGSNDFFPQQTDESRRPAFAILFTLPSQQICLVKSNTRVPQQQDCPGFFLLILSSQQ